MKFKKEYKNTVESIKFVLSTGKYKLISFVFGLIAFGFLYYFLVAKVADNNLWISVMMSGPTFVTFSIVSALITSALSGILFSMSLFKFNLYRQVEGKGLFGFIGSGIAAFGVGCPTCGAFLFGLIGMPLALMYLPFRGLELQVFGIFVLLISIYFTGKSLKGVCKIK
jgi:hypothetical protein